jgi:hypothetical protein
VFLWGSSLFWCRDEIIDVEAWFHFVGFGSGGLTNWSWDIGIHMLDQFLQIFVRIHRVVTTIGLFPFWDVREGEVDN